MNNDITTNLDFICACCGRPDTIASTVTLQANYGSIYDGERVKIPLCGRCFDDLYGKLRGHPYITPLESEF